MNSKVPVMSYRITRRRFHNSELITRLRISNLLSA